MEKNELFPCNCLHCGARNAVRGKGVMQVRGRLVYEGVCLKCGKPTFLNYDGDAKRVVDKEQSHD